MYRIAICDDHIEYLTLIETKIKEYCTENGFDIKLDTYSDSSQLNDLLDEKRMYDAYILDIEMPSVSGIELAEQIRTQSEDAQIIFLTAYDSYAVKACSIQVLNYLLKDQLKEELPNVLNGLFQKLEKQDEKKVYRISNQRKYIRLNHRDIIYIRKEQKNAVFILTDGRTEQERITLQELQQKLKDPELFMADRSLILNINHIKKISDGCIHMTDGNEIIIGKNNLSELKQYLTRYWSSLI